MSDVSKKFGKKYSGVRAIGMIGVGKVRVIKMLFYIQKLNKACLKKFHLNRDPTLCNL